MAINNFFILQGGLVYLPGWNWHYVLTSIRKDKQKFAGNQDEVGQLAVGQLTELPLNDC
jgi:hypothetical protein